MFLFLTIGITGFTRFSTGFRNGFIGFTRFCNGTTLLELHAHASPNSSSVQAKTPVDRRTC